MITVYPSSKAFVSFEGLDIQLSDLGPRLTMSEFSRKFRAAKPRLLVYELPQLGWRGYVVCAPVNCAFGALEVLNNSLAPKLIEWGSTLIDDADIYAAVLSQLRHSKIKKEHIPSTLLWPYTGYGAYVDNTKEPFGSKAPFLDYLRVFGWLLPVAASIRLESLLERVVRESGEWAFCEANDADANEVHARPPSLDLPALYGAPFVIKGEGTVDRVHRLTRLSDALSTACERLSAHPQKVFDSHCHDVSRPPLDLFANMSGFSREMLFDGLVADVVAKKIELAKLLAWPTFYNVMSQALLCYEEPAFADSKYDQIRKPLRTVRDGLEKKHGWLGEMKNINLFQSH